MRAAKAGTEPEIRSAMATAMSLADLTVNIWSALAIVTRVPTLKPILLG